MRCLAIVLIVIAAATTAAEPSGQVAIGEVLRDATMRGLNGPSRKLSDYRGEPLIINVWASWCGPCRAEMASLERLAWRKRDIPFRLIGISTDDYPERARAALKSSNATINHFIDRNLELEHMLGASRLPLTVLVNADGQVLRRIYGARRWDGPQALALIDQTFRPSQPATPRKDKQISASN